MKKVLAGLTAVALCISLSACSSDDDSNNSSTTAATTTTSASSTGGSSTNAAFPSEVKSCDETLKFDKAPERIVMLSETDAPILYDLGLLDKVVARAGQHRVPESQKDLRAALDKVKEVEAGDTGTGGAKMSTESILALNPDLVMGYDSGADREALKKAGVKLYSPDAMCENYKLDKAATFDLVDQEIDKMGAMFGVKDKADALKAQMQDKLNGINKPADGSAGTAAALFVMPGSTEFYSYGYSSMVQPIFEANGLKNSFADNSERVFDMTMENLLKADPDWIVLMADSPDPQSAKDVFNSYQGVDKLKAVKNNHVVFLPFILTDPPTTLSVEGAIELGQLLNQ